MSQADGFRFTVAIFDLDGLLIDSEPFWQDAEMEIRGRYGVWDELVGAAAVGS